MKNCCVFENLIKRVGLKAKSQNKFHHLLKFFVYPYFQISIFRPIEIRNSPVQHLPLNLIFFKKSLLTNFRRQKFR